MALAPEAAEGGSADQVGLGIEDVVDGVVGGQEPLGRARRFALSLLSLSSSDDQVRVFSPVIFPQSAWSAAVLAAQILHGGGVGGQSIVRDRFRMNALVLEQFLQQSQD
jgi:hypothetical protein